MLSSHIVCNVNAAVHHFPVQLLLLLATESTSLLDYSIAMAETAATVDFTDTAGTTATYFHHPKFLC